MPAAKAPALQRVAEATKSSAEGARTSPRPGKGAGLFLG